MKKIISILILALVLSSCNDYDVKESYTEKSTREFNSLKKPVVLIGKNKSLGLYGITVMDGDGKAVWFGNLSGIANTIGESRNIGDTIVK